MIKKKKSRTTLPSLLQGQLAHMSTKTLSNICEAELYKQQSPITHIDPAEYTPERLQALIRQASR